MLVLHGYCTCTVYPVIPNPHLSLGPSSRLSLSLTPPPNPSPSPPSPSLPSLPSLSCPPSKSQILRHGIAVSFHSSFHPSSPLSPFPHLVVTVVLTTTVTLTVSGVDREPTALFFCPCLAAGYIRSCIRLHGHICTPSPRASLSDLRRTGYQTNAPGFFDVDVVPTVAPSCIYFAIPHCTLQSNLARERC